VTTTPQVPEIQLNSGYLIPQLGFGVFKVDPDETERIVSEALEAGYRHIDTAKVYGNEEGVGRAIAKSGIPRDELFITTKLWNTEQGVDGAQGAIADSLERLGLDYVDLYLIHWPAPQRGTYVDTWLSMERVAASGLARSIGVSNFLEEHLDAVLEAGSVVPAVNQIELHPLFQQRALREYGESRGVKTEVWGPLGQGKYDLNELPVLTELADRYGKSVQQVVIRWHLQEGVIVFPKSATPERIRSNIDVFDFELTAEDMAAIAAIDANRRIGTHPLEGNW